MTSRILKAQAAEFKSKAATMLVDVFEADLVATRIYFDEYVLATSAGPLSVCINAEPGDILATLYCRFKDPAEAKKATADVNPYTGKWNWFWSRKEIDELGVGGVLFQFQETLTQRFITPLTL